MTYLGKNRELRTVSQRCRKKVHQEAFVVVWSGYMFGRGVWLDGDEHDEIHGINQGVGSQNKRKERSQTFL